MHMFFSDDGVIEATLAAHLWTLEELFRGNVIIHRARKAIQVDDYRPRRGSWLRFPWLSPNRNPTSYSFYRRWALGKGGGRT